jgi:hypothetical protein
MHRKVYYRAENHQGDDFQLTVRDASNKFQIIVFLLLM